MTEIIEAAPVTEPRRRGGRVVAVLLILIALADFLIFKQQPGINLFLFAMALAAGILLTARRFFPHALLAGLGASVAAAMPLVESPTILGFIFCLFGLAVLSLAGSGLLPSRLTILPNLLLRFALISPFRFLIALFRFPGRRNKEGTLLRISQNMVVWVVPVVSAIVFIALFRSANPIIEQLLDRIDLAALLDLVDPVRICFWLTVSGYAWPLLRPRLMRRRKRRIAETALAEISPESPLFGRAAILRSLVIFNLLFAVQTLLDLTYLWGGAALPDGMTHASYAHRGAYPLIATALLAALFVLCAMRPNGSGKQDPLIRALVYAWIGQNILLCISAMFRLDLYVDAYALTELRVAAGIWMMLVAIGLALILLRILLDRSNAWLIGMNLAVLAAMLYVSAFVDFPAVIARFNVEHSLELSGDGTPLDINYLRNLGPTTIPALDLYINAVKSQWRTKKLYAMDLRFWMAYQFENRSRDWRSWNYRNHQIDTYIAERRRPHSPPGDDNNSHRL